MTVALPPPASAARILPTPHLSEDFKIFTVEGTQREPRRAAKDSVGGWVLGLCRCDPAQTNRRERQALDRLNRK